MPNPLLPFTPSPYLTALQALFHPFCHWYSNLQQGKCIIMVHGMRQKEREKYNINQSGWSTAHVPRWPSAIWRKQVAHGLTRSHESSHWSHSLASAWHGPRQNRIRTPATTTSLPVALWTGPPRGPPAGPGRQPHSPAAPVNAV